MIEEINVTYNQIEEKIINHEIYQKVKDYSKTKEKMMTYLEIGKLRNSIDTKYGKRVVKEYSTKLVSKFRENIVFLFYIK